MKLYERIESNNFDEIDKNRAIELIEQGNGHLVYNENCFKLQSESKSYQMQAEEYLEHIKCLEAKIERLNGVIEGLKFAVRCNGVSGGEVL